MSAVASDRVRSRVSLSMWSVLGAGWFELWFFVVFPALILSWSGQGWDLPFGRYFWIGATLVVIAHAALVSEIVTFVRWGGTHVPLDPPPSLVANGLYRRVRNPMYMSYVAIAIGEAIAYRSWALVAYSATLAVLIHVYVIRIEEPGLLRRFGEDYERYAASTGRWFPFIRDSV